MMKGPPAHSPPNIVLLQISLPEILGTLTVSQKDCLSFWEVETDWCALTNLSCFRPQGLVVDLVSFTLHKCKIDIDLSDPQPPLPARGQECPGWKLLLYTFSKTRLTKGIPIHMQCVYTPVSTLFRLHKNWTKGHPIWPFHIKQIFLRHLLDAGNAAINRAVELMLQNGEWMLINLNEKWPQDS